MAEETAATTAAETQTETKTETAAETAAKTFTQDDVDRVVHHRLAKVKNENADELEELRAKAKKLAEIEDANKSELEKANAAREAAEAKSAKAIETANARLIQAEVLAAATAANALKPEHMHKLIDAADVKVGDDGQVTGVEEAVKAFLEANPEYVGTGRANGAADQGARGNGANQLTRDALKTMSPDEIAKALDDGRLANITGGN